MNTDAVTNMTDRIGDYGGGRRGESEGGVEEEKGVDGYVSRRAEGDISNSTSLTQGPRTMGTHHIGTKYYFV